MLMLTVLTAGHERKHSVCRSEIGGCISGQTSKWICLECHLHALLLLLNMQRCIRLACHKFTTVSGAIVFDQSDVDKPCVIL